MQGAVENSASLAGPVTALRLDADGRIADVTEAAARMLGMAPSELQGLTLGDLVVDKWRALADADTARILCGDNRAFQLLLRGPQDRRILVQMASCKVTRHDRSGYLLDWFEPLTEPLPTSAALDGPGLQSLVDGLLQTRETERKRIALKLDNEVAPLVVVGKYMIEDLLQRFDGVADPHSIEVLKGASGRLDQALVELQHLAAGLCPKMLDDLGLIQTIEWHCRSFEQKYSTVRVDRQLAVAETDIPEQLKLAIFRFVEEGLANVAQHANASAAEVVLMRAGDELLLWVQDNGEGFDAATPRDGSPMKLGIGLACIRERVEGTRGRFSLQSSMGNGTRVGAAWSLRPSAGGE